MAGAPLRWLPLFCIPKMTHFSWEEKGCWGRERTGDGVLAIGWGTACMGGLPHRGIRRMTRMLWGNQVSHPSPASLPRIRYRDGVSTGGTHRDTWFGHSPIFLPTLSSP